MKQLFAIFCLFGLLTACERSLNPISTDCTELNPCDFQPISAENLMVGDEPYVLISSKSLEFHVAFSRISETDEILEFTPIQADLPLVCEDQFGNQYDLFGKSINGPDAGRILKPAKGGLGYWFAWSSIYPRIEIEESFGEGEELEPISDSWLVPREFVYQGAILDGIPSLDYPPFIEMNNKDIFTTNLLSNDDEIIVVKIGSQIKIYPIKILNYHEVVNDTISGEPIVVCYAPFTGTASVWSSVVRKQQLDFGVSGSVFNNNILLFDRGTNSFWNQMLELCVNGDFIGSQPDRMPFFRCKWSTWKEIERSHSIMQVDNDFGFDYDVDPLGAYKNEHDNIPFNISNTDERLKAKEIVFTIVSNQQSKAFKFEH